VSSVLYKFFVFNSILEESAFGPVWSGLSEWPFWKATVDFALCVCVFSLLCTEYLCTIVSNYFIYLF